MRRTAITLLITLAVLLGSAGVSWSADFAKGQAAFDERDYKTALREFKPLAEQGDALAQFSLGVMYYTGKGVPQNMVYAYMWFNIAVSSGYKNASEIRDFIAELMTPADISTAQNLAQECMRKNFKGC
ncbi:MAG TPA: sel1 repeat family protein [Nitrospinota bacterium]|jgi:hypothetical protein|nr:sel1 repeat family protein [Nitrospinota bacterium]|tara:strand:+ start:365 stop:748 length:384 start_codon:yes stop_codon:yes gene_type:complete